MMLALDTEDTGVDLHHGAHPFFVSFCDEEGNNIYREDGSPFEWNVDPLTRKPLVIYNDLIEIQKLIDSADELILQNPGFDWRALQTVFCGRLKWDWGKVRCTLKAGHLLASNQPHDLTTMALVYLGVNVQPYEDRLKAACNEARRIARSKYPEWRIAKEGLPEMPSAKTGSKKDKKGVESESPWKFDCWLPRAIALKEDYPKNHAWWTVLSEYGNSDSTVTLPLYKIQKQLLEEKGLWKIYEEKLKLLSIITDMEERGVTASQKRCRELGKRYKDESAQAGRLCVNIAKSYDYDLTLPKSGNNGSLVKFCFGPLGLESLKKSKKTGEPSLDKEVLEQYEITLSTRSKPFHFVRAIRGKRKRDTAIGFINSYADKFGIPFLDDPDWMTLYPGLNDTGTGTLRGASSNPNGQQISKKEDFNLRYCFGPAPGREWYSCDYENIELRIPAYESGERVMIELFEKPDEPPYFGSYHLMNASIVYPDIFWPLAEKKGEFKKKYASTWYQYIKNFGFAVGYGAMLGSGTADRAAHYAEYLILYPNRRGSGGAQEQVVSRLKEHSKLNKKYIDFAEKHNYVETLPDKTVDPTRGYPIMCSRSPWGKISPTIPLNYHVQSTAMWCTTKSMIRCAEYLKSYPSHFMTLQVHDEIVFDFPQGDKRNGRIIMMVKSLMEQSGEDIGIPLTVAVNRHSNNWSESDSDWSVAT